MPGGTTPKLAIPYAIATDNVRTHPADVSKPLADRLEALLAATPKQASCRLTRLATLSIPSAANTVIPFTTERWDTDAMHDVAVNPSRITIQTAGIYELGACVAFSALGGGAGGRHIIQLKINGLANYLARQEVHLENPYAVCLNPTCTYAFNAGDYVEVEAYHDRGVAVDLIVGAVFSPEFWAHRLASLV